jgi:hypothetical protein
MHSRNGRKNSPKLGLLLQFSKKTVKSAQSPKAPGSSFFLSNGCLTNKVMANSCMAHKCMANLSVSSVLSLPDWHSQGRCRRSRGRSHWIRSPSEIGRSRIKLFTGRNPSIPEQFFICPITEGDMGREIWGRCYDHNFLRFFPIFGEKMAFFLNTNVMIKLFSSLALF